VSLGALAHESAVVLAQSVLRLGRWAIVALAPLVPVVSATSGWEFYTVEFPIPLGIATLAYGLSCAFIGPTLAKSKSEETISA
jgi:hypothetical protein